MNSQRIIHFPDGSNGTEAPQDGDIHSEYGRQWRYFEMPNEAGVPGVWRAADCTYVSGGPGWDLDSIKDWLEIIGDDLDDHIIAAMRITMSFVERYCNRLFEYREHHHELELPIKGNGWQLHLWPVKGSVYINGEEQQYLIDNRSGIVWFPNYRHTNFRELVYSGGYMPDEWPADLLMVLMNSIKHQWQIQTGGEAADKVSRITIPDVGTISYNAGTSWSTDIGLGTTFGPISQQDQIVLNLYRLWEC